VRAELAEGRASHLLEVAWRLHVLSVRLLWPVTCTVCYLRPFCLRLPVSTEQLGRATVCPGWTSRLPSSCPFPG
jgi:hypothetical protein